MPRMTPIELCIANLRHDFPPGAVGYQTEEEALAELRERTDQDFGLDLAMWEAWLKENPEQIAVQAKTPQDALRLLRSKKEQK